jgi:hypothetical protein
MAGDHVEAISSVTAAHQYYLRPTTSARILGQALDGLTNALDPDWS